MNKTTTRVMTTAVLAAMLSCAPAHARQHGAHSAMTMNGAHHRSMTMGASGLNALRHASGRQLDIAFLSQMIAHHQAAVDMARAARTT